MKKLLFIFTALGMVPLAQAQITIDANDLPDAGDTMRFSIASFANNVIDVHQTGTNFSWDFSNLIPNAQGVDEYRTAVQVNPTFALFLGLDAYGHLVHEDVFPFPLPPGVEDPYLFFKKDNSSFRLTGYAITYNGTQIPLAMDDDDEWYFLPLNYGDSDSSTFLLDFDLAGNAIKQEGYRKTDVDGWGTIKTPFFPNPVSCLRVKSYVDEVDTVSIGGTSIGMPRTYVDYKWLVKNEPYPALWVRTEVFAGFETVSFISYRDHYRLINSISNTQPATRELLAYPNPVQGDEVLLELPSHWKEYQITVFDQAGRLVTHQQNNNRINLSGLSQGNYVVRVISGVEQGMVVVVR